MSGWRNGGTAGPSHLPASPDLLILVAMWLEHGLTARPRPRRRLFLLPLLALAAAMYALSLFLPWHHRYVVETRTYQSVSGLQEETWVMAGAVFALVLLVLFSHRAPGPRVRILSAVFDTAMAVAVISDYLAWQAYAASINPTLATLQYVGPGFCMALAATVLLAVTTVLAWRRSE